MSRFPTSVLSICAIGLVTASFTRAIEITPSEEAWLDVAGQEKGVQVQVVPHEPRVSKTSRHFFVTVWIRNNSRNLARVPYPGRHWSGGLIQILDVDCKQVLTDRYCTAAHEEETLDVVPEAMRAFTVDIFAQRCCTLDTNRLKSGKHTVEFLGCRVPIDVTD